jgi:hypothetical protein
MGLMAEYFTFLEALKLSQSSALYRQAYFPQQEASIPLMPQE